ncbi:MAG: hypothetical protein CO113_14075 [Elusimicrobia bacterium CG_4_9_14_3_um_filter_62_55]|nr:MAG: hypothetical protein COR54_19420 [Elusimicrobia bacterium CG22_combo_CG10-13_8_21_14_all_63_91]PJB24371.1 MAG: hypothetical protein CO113_14075 [Elusimicrobia bacterium CG_4_9_14_3_um_filter_62_55]
MARKALVFTAHPYDDILACGGTLLKLRESGFEIRHVYFSAGPAKDRQEIAKGLDAMSQVLTSQFRVLDYEVGRISEEPKRDIIGVIESEIADFQPDWILTNNGNDVNIDHRTIFEASMIGARPSQPSCEKVLAFNLYTGSEWTPPIDRYGNRNNFYSDISGFLDRKIELCRLFPTEMRESPHPRSVEAIRGSAMLEGTQVGLHAVEGFQLIREEAVLI